MSTDNGQPTTEEFQRATEAIEDAVTFPLLTADVGSVGSRGSIGGGGSGGYIGGIADQAFREAIGWRYRRGDHRGFVAAITKAFSRSERDGRVEMKWLPQSYSVAADLGELTGALASLHQQATMVVERALPLLEALTPLSPVADLEDVATIRGLIRDELSELVGEFGRAGGPRVARVDNYFDLLLGPELEDEPRDPDPLKMKGQMKILRQRFGLRDERVNGVAEERNFTNYLILADQIFSLARMWKDKFDQFGAGGGKFLGVQLVSLSQLLAVIGESVQEAYAAMDSVFLSSAEREVYHLQLDDTTNMTIAELFSWAENFAATEGPRLLAQAGKDGVGVFHQTVTRLEELISLALLIEPDKSDSSGFSTKRVQRALGELQRHLLEAKTRSGKVQRTEVTFQEEVSVPGLPVPPRPSVTSPEITSIDPGQAVIGKVPPTEINVFGRRFVSGAQVEFTGDGIETTAVKFKSETELQVFVKVTPAALEGLRSLKLVQRNGVAELRHCLNLIGLQQQPMVLERIDPEFGDPGQTMDVTLIGRNFTELPGVSFGEGIEVIWIGHNPDDDPTGQILVKIQISGNAEEGPRDVVIFNSERESTAGFRVSNVPPTKPEKLKAGKKP